MRSHAFKMLMLGVLFVGLSACDESNDLLGPDGRPVNETSFAVDEDLSEAMFNEAEAEITSLLGIGTPGNVATASPSLFAGEPDPEKVEEARQLLEQARAKMREAREAWRAGDSETAAALAEEARRLVAQALLLVFGDEAVDRAFERIDHIITWLEERVDEQTSDLLARIRQLRDEAQARYDAGDSEGALERLLLARQIAGRDRAEHRRAEMAMHARLSIFMANSSIDLAVELIGEPTERQAHGLRHAAALVERAEAAFGNGRFRLAFELAREAVNISLVVVVRDTDLGPTETATLLAGVAAGAIAAAQDLVDPETDPVAARLLQHAENLASRGVELIETEPRKAVHVLWHAAVLANGIVFLVS